MPTLLDSLVVLATLSTPGENDIFQFLIEGNPGSMSFNQFSRRTGSLEEALMLEFGGRYSRTFSEFTQVGLLETKTSTAEVEAVPTPSLLWGMMASGGLWVFGKLRKRLEAS
ncbi:MAG: hypothetical protein WBG38_14300 [Nodosilinea sp.]